MSLQNNLTIVNADLADLQALHEIEELSFSGKAASLDAFRYRLEKYSRWFFKAVSDEKIVAFINGCSSDRKYITDDLYLAGSPFLEEGENLLIFGLAVLPEFQGKGIARLLMERILTQAIKSGKKRASLTCKQSLIPFYEKLGYRNHGLSLSAVGGIKFYDMELDLLPFQTSGTA